VGEKSVRQIQNSFVSVAVEYALTGIPGSVPTRKVASTKIVESIREAVPYGGVVKKEGKAADGFEVEDHMALVKKSGPSNNLR
jgi:hypothetical protein